MTNAVNEYLKKRPALGTVAFVLLIIVGHAVWVMMLESNRSFANIFSDTGFWFVTAIFAVPMGVGYFIMAKKNYRT